MPKVAVYNIEGASVGEIELADNIFGIEINKALLHQVVRMQLNNKRQGTQSAKTRAEVEEAEQNPGDKKVPGVPVMVAFALPYG